MSTFKYISHEEFPEDQYTKELVYFCIDDFHRVAYVRKASRNGGMFWSKVSIGVTKNGKKEYFDGYMNDSGFLDKDIKDFLDKRKWEEPKSVKLQQQYQQQPQQDNLPF